VAGPCFFCRAGGVGSFGVRPGVTAGPGREPGFGPVGGWLTGDRGFDGGRGLAGGRCTGEPAFGLAGAVPGDFGAAGEVGDPAWGLSGGGWTGRPCGLLSAGGGESTCCWTAVPSPEVVVGPLGGSAAGGLGSAGGGAGGTTGGAAAGC
jgi:hypothetical protein